jgi:drug/metabolite transporter (DMT)-like permease
VLGVIEGRRSFDQMSLPRFAGWGALGGVLLSTLFVLGAGMGADVLVGLGVVFGLSGAICAGGSLALARRATDPESLARGGKRQRRKLGRGGR